jgi:hypothetical protein
VQTAHAEKGYAVRRDFRGFTGPLFEARCRVRAPQPGVVGVEKTGPRQSLLPAGFWDSGFRLHINGSPP